VQQDAFFGVLLDNKVFQHKYIDWDFVSGFLVMCGLVPIFKELLLYEFCKHKCNWNDNAIRQFYATVQIDFVNEKKHWMIGTRRYLATFEDFANVNELD
jgi:hypothetical protein